MVITKRKRSTYFRRQAIDGWLFASLVVGGTIVFNIFPMLFSFVTGFTEWDGFHIPQFNWFENYRYAFFEDPFFRAALNHTIYYTFGSIPLSMIGGLVLAILVNQKLRGITWFKTAYFSPVVSSTIAIAIVWSWVLSPRYGLINRTLSFVGIAGPDWLTSTTWAMPAVIMVSVWQRMGYVMILYLAGLQGVPRQLYEAADIDGASKWAKFIKITVPLISPTTFFVAITSFIASFQVFGLIYIMTEGGPGRATEVYIYYLWQNAFAFFKMGYASTLAWILFAIIGVITVVQWVMAKRWVHYQ